MTVPPPQAGAWCAENGWGEIRSVHGLTGGDVSHVSRLDFGGGRSLVLKTKQGAPPDTFTCEAEGLAALTVEGGPRVPDVLFVGPDFLLLEDLQPAAPRPGYWEDFGRRLAALHLHTSDRYGFTRDNYCGETRQPNPWTESGHVFFADHRLRHQARLARDGDRLEAADARRIETVCERLPDLVPPQSPALVHGDLWHGNALSGPAGEPALIDPAAHYGWAEAELAMTLLFGGFPPSFYAAYAETYPLALGWRSRADVYNLYHLLNHLNVFGRGYLPRVRAVLDRCT